MWYVEHTHNICAMLLVYIPRFNVHILTDMGCLSYSSTRVYMYVTYIVHYITFHIIMKSIFCNLLHCVICE